MANLRFFIYLLYASFNLKSFAASANHVLHSTFSSTPLTATFVAPQYHKPQRVPCIFQSETSLDVINITLKEGPPSLFHLLPDVETIWWKNNKDKKNKEHKHFKIPRNNNSGTTTATTPTTLNLHSKFQFSNESESSFAPYNITKSLLHSLTASICKVTGKDTYTFGDISTYLDAKAKTEIRNRMKLLQQPFQTTENTDNGAYINDGQKDSNTSILELSQRLDLNFQKYTSQHIQSSVITIQKVSRTIIRKVATGDYQLSDITFLCKILIALGADFSPVAGLLPVKLLLELFGYSLVIDLGERFLNVIIQELDKRLQSIQDETCDRAEEIVLLDQQGDHISKSFLYSPGDLTRNTILSYIGKEVYQIGDIRDKLVMKNNDSNQMTFLRDAEMINTNDLYNEVDIIKELEECLLMERELVEKLNNIGKK